MFEAFTLNNLTVRQINTQKNNNINSKKIFFGFVLDLN